MNDEQLIGTLIDRHGEIYFRIKNGSALVIVNWLVQQKIPYRYFLTGVAIKDKTSAIRLRLMFPAELQLEEMP